jgi:hypothetical protein
MTQPQLADLPTLPNELERLRFFHTHDKVDVEMTFDEIFSEFFREALRHTRSITHQPTVVLHGPRSLTITNVN